MKYDKICILWLILSPCVFVGWEHSLPFHSMSHWFLRNIPDCLKVTRLWNADRDKNRDNKNNSDNKGKGKNRDKGASDTATQLYFSSPRPSPSFFVLNSAVCDISCCFENNIPNACVCLSVCLTCSLFYIGDSVSVIVLCCAVLLLSPLFCFLLFW